MIVLDWVSLFFIRVVSLISGRVLFYSSGYIADEKFFSRFILLVLSFVVRMWILILSPNFIRILLGWDGLGVTSYLLVIYFQSEKSYRAGIVTALTNRLGDAGLLCLLGAILQLGRWSFIYYRTLTSWCFGWIVILTILVAITKRAQIPFSAWLPAAIAAPTPVSSLVHSSTLVTAGVYLLIRLNYLLARQVFLRRLILLGVITICIAGRAALGETDIKKIIALSTLRQLGLIFITLGLGLPIFRFFHLVAHAYFKAILFICAGGVIHSIKEYQDMRKIGGGVISLPLSFRIFTTANLSLCGLPFITGFFSKDLILELIMIKELSVLRLFLAGIATILTVLYSLRATWLVYFSPSARERGFLIEEPRKIMFGGISFLLVPSVVGGLLISWVVISASTIIYLPFWLKIAILTIILVSTLLRFYLPVFQKRFILRFIRFIWFLPFSFPSTFSKARHSKGKAFFLLSEGGWRRNLISLRVKKIRGLTSNIFGYRVITNFLRSILILFFLWAI